MKVSDGVQKRILWDLFYQSGIGPNGQPFMQQREVDIADLVIASSAKKKLVETLEDNKFVEGEIEFTLQEAGLLSKWFIEKKKWPVNDADGVAGLRKLFEIDKEIPNEK